MRSRSKSSCVTASRLLLLGLVGCRSPGDKAADSASFAGRTGTALVFEPDADLSDPAHFFDLPWPLDSRLTADGHPDVAGLPRGDTVSTEQLWSLVAEADRFSQVPTVVFRFDGPIAQSGGLAAGPQPIDLVQFVDVDVDSPGFGERIPAFVGTPQADPFTPSHALVVQPVHGFVLRAGTTWAVVVDADWGDATGQPLGLPPTLDAALSGRGELAEVYRPLIENVDVENVSAATVFTTGDVVADTHALSEAVRSAHPPVLEPPVLAEDGATHARFCELHTTLSLPQFQQGEPPFDSGGSFHWDGENVPPVERTEEVPVVLTLPLGTMPEGGWPVVFYAHGSGGRFDQVVDRGPVLEEDGAPTPGLGPAHVLAYRGIAAVGMGLLLGESRAGGHDGRGYLNLANLRAYRDTWRQGMVDTRLLFDALADLRVPPDAVSDCGGLALPDGADAHRLKVDHIGMMGQSAGGHLTMEVAALDERVQAAVPTGAGGYWTLVMTLSPRTGVPPEVTAAALGTSVVPDALHPGMALLQHGWEAADPLIYAPRMSVRPLEDYETIDIYMPMGLDDGYFPEPIFDAMALAAGLDRAGEPLREETDARLQLGGLEVDVAYPVTDNQGDWTGAAVWWPPDGVADSHGVFAQYDGIKHQYGCFFRTSFDVGTARLVAPGAETDPCGD